MSGSADVAESDWVSTCAVAGDLCDGSAARSAATTAIALRPSRTSTGQVALVCSAIAPSTTPASAAASAAAAEVNPTTSVGRVPRPARLSTRCSRRRQPGRQPRRVETSTPEPTVVTTGRWRGPARRSRRRSGPSTHCRRAFPAPPPGDERTATILSRSAAPWWCRRPPPARCPSGRRFRSEHVGRRTSRLGLSARTAAACSHIDETAGPNPEHARPGERCHRAAEWRRSYGLKRGRRTKWRRRRRSCPPRPTTIPAHRHPRQPAPTTQVSPETLRRR